jgi:integrase
MATDFGMRVTLTNSGEHRIRSTNGSHGDAFIHHVPGLGPALAEAIDPRYRALVLIGAYGGLRVGEMGALRRSSIQLPRGVVRVEETLVEISGRVSFQPPKTRAARRAVALPAAVAVALTEHVDTYAGGGSRDLVFRSPEGGPMRLASWRRRFWLPALARAGLDGVRIRDLRHTAVALWIATGANPKQNSVPVGHTSVSFTLDRHGHLFEDAGETLAGRLNSVYVDLEQS